MQKLPGVTKPFLSGIYSTVAMNNSGQIVGFGGNLGGAFWPTPTSQPQTLVRWQFDRLCDQRQRGNRRADIRCDLHARLQRPGPIPRRRLR